MRQPAAARLSSLASSLALAASLAFAPVTAFADAASDKAAAAASFQVGAAAYAKADFRAAAAAFENAYRIAPRGAAIYNAGLAWEGAGDAARAADAYSAALARSDLAEGQAKDARFRLEKLQHTLGRLQVNVPADATVSIERIGTMRGSGTAHVTPGDRDVRVVYADGRSETRRVYVFAGGQSKLEFTGPVAASPPAALSGHTTWRG